MTLFDAPATNLPSVLVSRNYQPDVPDDPASILNRRRLTVSPKTELLIKTSRVALAG
jgi:hypothetical protein